MAVRLVGARTTLDTYQRLNSIGDLLPRLWISVARLMKMTLHDLNLIEQNHAEIPGQTAYCSLYDLYDLPLPVGY